MPKVRDAMQSYLYLTLPFTWNLLFINDSLFWLRSLWENKLLLVYPSLEKIRF